LAQRTERHRLWIAFAASLVVYLAATAVMGAGVLQHPSTTVIHDPGDPLLTAAILHWTTPHVPLTDAWWQFPIFFPTRDALAFSEPLLGLSVVATPVEWITRDALTTYNLVALLTNPLCGAAMFALVWRLTRSGPAAFLAGVAYAFAPYRVSQSPHIQMLAIFWAPLSLLGLHAYVETRRARWLALHAVCWPLQALANLYCLFFFSLLVGLWVLWFVVVRADWRALGAIAASTALAALPLAPVVDKYLDVHSRHALVRSIEEVRIFSADVGAVLCAPSLLTFWGWVRVHCRPEGEIFPGVALFAIACVGGVVVAARSTTSVPVPRRLLIARWVFFALAAPYLLVLCSIVAYGPWKFTIGSVVVTATSLTRPILISGPPLAIAVVLWAWSKRQPPHVYTLSFYLVAALVTWGLSLGPEVMWMGKETRVPGLFNLLLYLPGVDGLRVPARFWAMALLCLSIAAGIVVSHLFRNRDRLVARIGTVMLGTALLADGMAVMPSPPAPTLPAMTMPIGGLVMRLPISEVLTDVASTYAAVTGGWRSVNGYSGYVPNYYPALHAAVDAEKNDAFQPFQAYGPLDVLVHSEDASLRAYLDRQPGARFIESAADIAHYRLPAMGRPDEARSAGRRLPIASMSSSCGRESLKDALDGVRDTGWTCYSLRNAQTLDIDLGQTASVGSVVTSLAQHWDTYPVALTVETSPDGDRWERAWEGSLLAQVIRGGIVDPNSLRLTVPFTPRQARYIRLTHPAMPDPYYWWISELEVWSGNTGLAPQIPNP
jgi:hypothetical protein